MTAEATGERAESLDARTIAARKLAVLFEEARSEGQAEKMLEVIRALGATGSAEAAETLKEIYDRTESHKDRPLQHEVIRALGEVGRSSHADHGSH